MDKLNTQRKVIVGASALGILCTFLPWANAPIVGAISGTEGDGWITLLIFLVPLVLALRGNKLLPLGPRASYAAAGAALVAGVIGIWKIVDVNSVKSSLGDNEFGSLFTSSISVGFGLYLLVIAAAAVIFGALFMKAQVTPASPKVEKPTK